MKKYLNKVLIIDGSYMLHRSLHTPALEELSTTTGMKSGGVFGSLRILQAEIKKFPGYFPIVCWDKGLSERRTTLFPDYKANRERLSADELLAKKLAGEPDVYLEEYRRQREDLIQILGTLGVPSIIIPGWEGDDLQYIISKSCEEGIILSDDKDMIQLVSPTIKIRRALRDELISWDNSDDYYKHPRFTIRKAIVGDGSDNIPQCAKGLGDTGADKIAQIICDGLKLNHDEVVDTNKVKEFLEEFVKTSSDKIAKKVQLLIDNWSQFEINYQLTDLRLVEVPVGFESMLRSVVEATVRHTNLFESYKLLGKYEMNTIYPDQIIGMLGASRATLLKS